MTSPKSLQTVIIPPAKAFYEMSLQELSDWVVANNIDPDTGDCIFDDLPQIEDLSDEEELAAFDEYEAMADEITYIRGAL